MKKQTGITLIALVITIIILLILAGIVIFFGLGDKGIITKAITAKNDTDEAKIKEEIEMILLQVQIDKQDTITLDDLQLWIGSNQPDISIIDNRPEENTIDLYYQNSIIKVSNDLKIIEIIKSEFNIIINKKIKNEQITITPIITSNISNLTVTKIKFGEEVRDGSEATFNLNYPRNL